MSTSDSEAPTSVSGSTGTKRPISERSVFILQELLKLRRLTRDQFTTLCRLGPTKSASKFPIWRLAQKGLVAHDYLPIGRKSQPLIKLTETGHRHAAISMGRDHESHYRDYVAVDFLAHLLVINDLYLRIVAQGASDWAAVRQHASFFEWYASNDDTSFIWDAPAEFKGDRRQRRVVPDVTIETETTRYLVEVERSTKTQAAVARKVELYSHLFSPLRSAHDKPGYARKYPDAKKPVVVFVFTDERRAQNARAHFERRAKAQDFYIPAWKCGSVEGIGEELRRELVGRGVAAPVVSTGEILERYKTAIQSYVVETSKQLGEIRRRLKKNEPVPMPTRPAALDDMASMLRELNPAMRTGEAP